MILVIDNYDSFTWNLVQYLWELGAKLEVVRNDAITVDDIHQRLPKGILVSPGPCAPAQAGVSVDAIRVFSGQVPILGVCLGHQAIGEAFGGTVARARTVMHGKTSAIRHDGTAVFSGLPERLPVGRYHSLSIQQDSLPAELRVVATSEDDGEIMAIAHREHPTWGVQFHPESVLTPDGKQMLRTFVEAVGC